MTEQISSGIELMFAGMGIVYLFLIMLVVAINLMSAVVLRYFPESLPKFRSEFSGIDKSTVAAISAAVHHYRSKHHWSFIAFDFYSTNDRVEIRAAGLRDDNKNGNKKQKKAFGYYRSCAAWRTSINSCNPLADWRHAAHLRQVGWNRVLVDGVLGWRYLWCLHQVFGRRSLGTLTLA